MPDAETRRALLTHLLSGQPSRLSRADIERIVAATSNYSGSDLAALCREAAIIPIRQSPFASAGRECMSNRSDEGFLCSASLLQKHGCPA